MTAVEYIDISNNQLSVLPDSLWSLSTLRTVRASRNGILSFLLPQTSSRLVELDLSDNRMLAFPWQQIGTSFPSLRKLDLRGNPLARSAEARAAAADAAAQLMSLEIILE
jgi:Leucine-rich repeat (LRR) protein